jgi:hypothetical protein
MGTCPKCDKVVGHVNLAEVTASALFGKQWRTLKYCCPNCQCVLGVQILSGQGKSGHAWSLQNRPYEMARDVVLIYPAFS